jgi:parallel beta-helix repeat protein
MNRHHHKIKKFLIAILFFGLIIYPLVNTNSAIIEEFEDASNDSSIPGETNETKTQFQYVIITSESLKNSSFQNLLEHKSQYMNATLVTTEEIIKNKNFWVGGKYGDSNSIINGNPWVEDGEEVKNNLSLFNDSAAKIRNFIRYACHELQTKFVLLGGDVEIIPNRNLYVKIPEWYSGFFIHYKIHANIASDQYYACLNNSWNIDCDSLFGEQKNFSINDEADFFADVFVGRAPVSSLSEVDNFVEKVISFETSKKPKHVQLHQSNINQLKKPDTIVIPNACEKLIPEDYTIHKLYELNQKVTINDWIQCFSYPSKLAILHIGNGYHDPTTLTQWYQLSKDIRFSNFDVNKLENQFYPIHISISCLTGNFTEHECLAEELLLWSRGGPSACLFNSEVGCISQNNALSYSGEFIEKEFYELFANNSEHLGEILQLAKQHFVNEAYNNSLYRMCYFEINLLGDPEMIVHSVRNRLPPFKVYVDDNYTDITQGWNITRFDSIQKAIDSLKPKGVIYVMNGTYYETVLINKTLDLIGEDKYNTIICGVEGNTIVTLRTNSSKLENFTITHCCPDTKGINGAGIFIPANCEGNEIKNNIFTGNNKYGVYISGACRNFILNNLIESNGIGVAIINERNGLFETSFIITCDNMISNNTIRDNDQYGIYLESSIHNHIVKNNFINNSNSDAFYFLSKHTDWVENYWGKPLSSPKKIFGIKGPIFIGFPDFSNGWQFPDWKWVAIINIGYPWFDYDYNPAQKPYSN